MYPLHTDQLQLFAVPYANVNKFGKPPVNKLAERVELSKWYFVIY